MLKSSYEQFVACLEVMYMSLTPSLLQHPLKIGSLTIPQMLIIVLIQHTVSVLLLRQTRTFTDLRQTYYTATPFNVSLSAPSLMLSCPSRS